ncbi:ABC transporter substrate-binding protein [Marinoscillum sp. MHG1-6]|uniref:ABC transporter substrate-binding protein n=1 Tax=Marinoscillum sp. MHG1-6 TaxID=2959627 RepID=UPI002156FFF6|nr:ABC transporter substrate-binding protein [Marinoscillum sp. MHG1-6]
MTTLRLGGVPEYFNLPIHQAFENGTLEAAGIQLEWVNVPEGTGKMSSMLWDGELDMAIILTEGITKSIIDGNPSRIIKNYVESPLLWGIHVPHSENPQPIDNINDRRIAISRFGSGSHLMSFVMAKNHGWNLQNLHFEVVNNLKGALESFREGESDVFLWEKYTTKPYVDNHEFSRVGIVATPWPCFVIAAGLKSLESKKAAIRTACEIISNQCQQTQRNPELANLISSRFDLKKEDADQIITEVKWSHDLSVDGIALRNVMNTLKSLGLIQLAPALNEVIHTLT